MSWNRENLTFDPAERFRNRFAPLGGVGNESTPVQNGHNTQRRLNESTTVSQQANVFSALTLDEKLTLICSKLENLEDRCQHLPNMASQVQHTTTQLNQHSTFLKKLAYHSIDQEARSRRNNLIFYGLADIRGEDVVDVISQFLFDYFDLELNNMGGFQRIHRLGSIAKARRMTQYPKRPIIVAFIDYRDTETIMSQAYRLAGTHYGVDRDHPREIAEARKSLWNFKKKQGYSARDKVAIQYPAKLVVNGREVRNEFPDWHSVMNESRLAIFKQNEFNQTVSHSNSHLYSVATEIDQSGMSYSFQSQPISTPISTQLNSSDSPVSDTSLARASQAQSAVHDNRSPATASHSTAGTHAPGNNTPPAQTSLHPDSSNIDLMSNRDFPPLSGQSPSQGGNSRFPPNDLGNDNTPARSPNQPR